MIKNVHIFIGYHLLLKQHVELIVVLRENYFLNTYVYNNKNISLYRSHLNFSFHEKNYFLFFAFAIDFPTGLPIHYYYYKRKTNMYTKRST